MRARGSWRVPVAGLIGAAVLAAGCSSSVAASEPAITEPSPVPTTVAVTTTLPPSTLALVAPTPVPLSLPTTSTTDDPQDEATGTTFWTVVVESAIYAPGAQGVAEREASRARRNGFPAQVIDTRSYSSLTPGYYATISGEFGSREEADAHRAKVRANGFADAYRVCVGDVGLCPADHRSD